MLSRDQTVIQSKWLFAILMIWIFSLTVFTAKAQVPQLPGGFKVDTVNKETIHLISSEMGTFLIEDNITLNILKGNVAFEHKGDKLYADSARLNISKNIVHAYGNVKIEQTDGTVIYADKMFYDGNTKNVELIGAVELHSGEDHLWSEKLDYNLKSQIGKYNNKGTLQTGNTVIESKSAVYNGKTHDARFKGDVNVLDPEYEVVSADLNYNTQTKLVSFFGPSIINNDSSTLFTTKGTYDSEKEIAIFKNRSSIQSDAQYMEADSMYYDRKTGWGFGTGNVILIDTSKKTTLYCTFSAINEQSKQALATGNPYAVMARDKDTTYITADTFFAEPTKNLIRIKQPQNAQDSLLLELDMLTRKASTGELLDSNLVKSLDSLHQEMPDIDTLNVEEIMDFRQGEDTAVSMVDTTKLLNTDTIPILDTNLVSNIADTTIIAVDSSKTKGIKTISKWEDEEDDWEEDNQEKKEEPRYFIAYRNVVVYNDSFQAKADSMSYIQDDSLMQFFYKPILWSRNAQVTGEIIKAFVDTNELRWVHVPKNGIIVNQSTTANEVMFDQIQGNEIWAYLKKNEMDSVLVFGNAQTIYFIQDEDDAFVGASEATSQDLKIIFYEDSSQKRSIKEIIYYAENTQKTTPMRETHPELLRLSRFVWRRTEKLNKLEDFFEFVYRIDKTEKPLLKEEIKDKLKKKDKDN